MKLTKLRLAPASRPWPGPALAAARAATKVAARGSAPAARAAERGFSGSGLFSIKQLQFDGVENFAIEQRERDALERVAIRFENVASACCKPVVTMQWTS